MRLRLILRTDEILECLRDSPNARVPFPRRPEQLHQLGRRPLARLYTSLMALVSTLSSSEEESVSLLSPIMCLVRFFRNAIFSRLGDLSPGGKSHGLRASLPSKSTSMTRPPISSTNGR